MAKNRTDKSKYTSPSTGGFCTPAQYVAELMCQRQSEKSNEGSLPHKFWNKSKWKGRFIHQVKLAHEIIEEFGDRALVKALQQGMGNRVFSLRHPKIKDLVRIAKKKLESEKLQQKTIDFEDNSKAKPKKPFKSKKTNWRKLDG
tara:strand:+ start:2888 stop:3319 length:432 start_codon:yes stop_codon:yes gene_type:complete